jgi:hypothetical protein
LSGRFSRTLATPSASLTINEGKSSSVIFM